jgi:cytochrome b involved in lipid metabolism
MEIIVLIVFAFFCVLASLFLFFNRSPKTSINQTELEKHSDRSSCWVAYDGVVYDITDWLLQHPGGISAIESYCGTAKEFQEAFTTQHGTSNVNILKSQGKALGNYA